MNTTNPPLAELYVSHNKTVVNLAFKYQYSLPGAEVQDLVNDCWTAIIDKYPSYDSDRAGLSTWIYMISKTKLNQMVREAHRHKREVQFHTQQYKEDPWEDDGKGE